MYIDWQSKKTKTVFRFISYGIISSLTIATTIWLVYMAKGYRFDTNTGEVVQNGLLLVDSHPTSASIKINNKTYSKTPGRYVLPVGKYDLALSADGYRSWHKKINIEGSAVTQVYYPRLFPDEIASVSVKKIRQPEIYSMSNDQKNIFIREKSDFANLATIYSVKSPDKPVDMPWPADLPKVGGAMVDLIEWSQDGKKVLLKYSNKDRVNYLSLDLGKSFYIYNLSTMMKLNLTDPHFAKKNGESMYAVSNGKLLKFDIPKDNKTIVAAQPVTLLDKVIQYEPYGDSLILFGQQNGNTTRVGILDTKNSATHVIKEIKYNPNDHLVLGYREYSGDQYFVFGSRASNKVWIYANPLKAAGGTEFKPMVTLKFSANGETKFSGNGQFAMLQNGHKLLVFDFDDRHTFRYDAQIALSTQSVQWMDDARLTVNVDNHIYVWDYDNANLQKLLDTDSNLPALFSDGYQKMWTVNYDKVERTYTLELSSLDAKKSPQSLLGSGGGLF